MPVQLVIHRDSQQAPHKLAGHLLGSDLEDCRGEHVEALGWASRNDSSAKAISDVVGQALHPAEATATRRQARHGAASPPWNQTWCELRSNGAAGAPKGVRTATLSLVDVR